MEPRRGGGLTPVQSAERERWRQRSTRDAENEAEERQRQEETRENIKTLPLDHQARGNDPFKGKKRDVARRAALKPLMHKFEMERSTLRCQKDEALRNAERNITAKYAALFADVGRREQEAIAAIEREVNK